MNLHDIQIEAGACAKEKGFWDDPLNVGEQLMLICTEASEAIEDYRNHDVPDGPRDLGFEINELMFWEDDGGGPYSAQKTEEQIEQAIQEDRDNPDGAPLLTGAPGDNRRVTPWPDEWRISGHRELYKPCGFPSELADIVIRVAQLSARMGIDLDAAVQEKLRYNRTRASRHGGKRV